MRDSLAKKYAKKNQYQWLDIIYQVLIDPVVLQKIENERSYLIQQFLNIEEYVDDYQTQ